jgi:hypothetical protein
MVKTCNRRYDIHETMAAIHGTVMPTSSRVAAYKICISEKAHREKNKIMEKVASSREIRT